jgi:hypothetical protein
VWGAGGVVETASAANRTLREERSKKNVIIQLRPCLTIKACVDAIWREWNNNTIDAIFTLVKRRFPAHNVLVISANDKYWSDCFACQVQILCVVTIALYLSLIFCETSVASHLLSLISHISYFIS